MKNVCIYNVFVHVFFTQLQLPLRARPHHQSALTVLTDDVACLICFVSFFFFGDPTTAAGSLKTRKLCLLAPVQTIHIHIKPLVVIIVACLA